MATNHTTNYQLNQWEATDQVLRTDFNEDNAKLDAALAGLAETAAAHGAAIARLGNCKLWTTSYQGTGQYGEGTPQTIAFPQLPLFTLVGSDMGHLMFLMRGQYVAPGIKPETREPCFWNLAEWSGSTLSWYSDSASTQMNLADHEYYVLALLDAGA